MRTLSATGNFVPYKILKALPASPEKSYILGKLWGMDARCRWGKLGAIWFWCLLMLAACSSPKLGQISPAAPMPTARPPIRVVMDNNYPPYVFQDEQGQIKGILIDQWKLWEQRTGIPVKITAIPWGEALDLMRAGNFDVIDTIFYTDERAQTFDFTAPYAQINVLIFFNKNISGISQADDLKGFRVAVKSGDANVEYLQSHGVSNLTYYEDYESIIQAAARQQETIFVIDQPPAMYFLYKYGLQERFNYSAPLYGGAFHRAVKKGDAATLTLVNTGFGRITPAEYQAINKRWLGAETTLSIKPLLPYLGIGGVIGSLLLFILLVFNRTLQTEVNSRTQELKEALTNLRESRKFLADLIENSGALVFVKDTAGRYELLNRKWEQVTGLNRQQALGKTDNELFDLATAEQYRRHDAQALETGQVVEVEETFDGPDGPRHFIAIKFPVQAEDGHVKSICGMITEITDRKQAEQAQRASEAQVRTLNASLERRVAERTVQLELANKELEAFTYSVSHDLRAPLRAINGYTRLIQEEYGQQFEGEAYELFERVRTASQNMGALIDALLSLSRQMRVEMHWEEVDLSALAEKITTRLREAQPERQVVCSITPGLTAQGDGHLLEVALENLFDNAWKYTRPMTPARIEFSAIMQDGQQVFFVRDNGVGFNIAYAGRIFDAFQRLHPPEEFEGEGIGLATVQRIIRRHNGRIWAESQVGQGATFYFVLPDSHPA